MHRSSLAALLCSTLIVGCSSSTPSDAADAADAATLADASATDGGGGADTGVDTGAETGADAGTDAGGSLGVPADRCDNDLCQQCWHASTGSDCAIVDNPCNDDSACDPLENTWVDCICNANGDATTQAACDQAFQAGASQAAAVVSCARRSMLASCRACYQKRTGLVCPSSTAACETCAKTSCGAPLGACLGDKTCAAAFGAFSTCACGAELGTGALSACEQALGAAGGAAASTALTCLQTSCASVCGF